MVDCGRLRLRNDYRRKWCANDRRKCNKLIDVHSLSIYLPILLSLIPHNTSFAEHCKIIVNINGAVKRFQPFIIGKRKEAERTTILIVAHTFERRVSPRRPTGVTLVNNLTINDKDLLTRSNKGAITIKLSCLYSQFPLTKLIGIHVPQKYDWRPIWIRSLWWIHTWHMYEGPRVHMFKGLHLWFEIKIMQNTITTKTYSCYCTSIPKYPRVLGVPWSWVPAIS